MLNELSREPELVVTVTEFRRHFNFIVEAILPIEGVINVTYRGRVLVVLVAPEVWNKLQRWEKD